MALLLTKPHTLKQKGLVEAQGVELKVLSSNPSVTSPPKLMNPAQPDQEKSEKKCRIAGVIQHNYS
jgi:hypothetical protein